MYLNNRNQTVSELFEREHEEATVVNKNLPQTQMFA